MSTHKLSGVKELNNLLKEATQHGWEFTKGRKHIKGRNTITNARTSCSVSPSCPFVLLKIRKDLGM